MFAVAIDGPAGAGKSSIAKAVAALLGFIYVDTGALYRTVALQLLNKGIKAEDIAGVREALAEITVSMQHKEDGQHVFLNGTDVSEEIRTTRVSMMASTSSAVKEVREFLFDLQVKMAEEYNVIMDGRDIGTVVLPNAQVKIFLTASPEIRAKRRFLQEDESGKNPNYQEILDSIKQRDYQDTNREVSPLKMAADSILLDTSNLNFNEVVKEMVSIIKGKWEELGES